MATEAPSFIRPGSAEQLIERIRASVIGDDAVLHGPFGPRRLVYADYTASGRSLTFIGDFIRERTATGASTWITSTASSPATPA